MQRILSSFTLCLYVVLTVGLSLHTHYCMGREVGHSLMPRTDAPDWNKACCQDTVIPLRLTEEHITTDVSVVLSAQTVSPWISLTEPTVVEITPETDAVYRRYSSQPPLPPPVPRYVRFLSLIYYA